MAELFKVNAPVRKPLFEGVQGENEARSIQFDITPWVEELGDGVVTATAKRSQDSQPYPVTVTKDGNIVTWKPTSTDTAYAGVGSFQLEYTVDSVLAKTCIWSTMVAPSLDPAGDPPDPYDNWLAEMRQIAADALQSEQNADTSAKTSEAWAVGQRGGVDVPSTDPTYENNAKYWAEQSLANQYGAYIVKSASGEIASFSDGADDVPMRSLKVAIVPKQSGSGDPSPYNVRPITGTSTANVTVVGKNLFTLPINISGTGYINRFLLADYPALADFFKTLQQSIGKTVVLSCVATGTPIGAQIGTMRIFANGETLINIVPNTPAVLPEKDYLSADSIYIYGSTNPTTIKDYQFEFGSVATDYEPYNGHTTPVPLGQTVYGGEVDVVTGELTITSAMVDMGTLTWSDAGSGNTLRFYANPTPNAKAVSSAAVVANIACEKYTPASYGDVYDHIKDTQVSIGTNGYIYANDSSCATAAAFKTAVNGVKLVYEVANPTTVQLTPAQVATLLGTNNVWSDSGSVEVEYRADPTLAYNELANVIVSLGGNI